MRNNLMNEIESVASPNVFTVRMNQGENPVKQPKITADTDDDQGKSVWKTLIVRRNDSDHFESLTGEYVYVTNGQDFMFL